MARGALAEASRSDASPRGRPGCPVHTTWIEEGESMPIVAQGEALETLSDGQSRLDALFARISDEDMLRPATIGDSEWAAKDLMGHVAFWEELAVEAVSAWRDGRPPEVARIFAKGRRGIDEANARNQSYTGGQSLAEVRDRAEAAHVAVLKAIAEIAEDEWCTEVSTSDSDRSTLAELLGTVLGAPKRPFGHAFAHLPDLEAYVESLRGGRQSNRG